MYNTSVLEPDANCTAMSGELPVKAQCLPFSQIPHTTKLFSDYLSYTPQVQQFYPRSAHFTEWVRDEATRVQYDETRRARVADILERQNRAWGAAATTLQNIQQLRNGAYVMVTGQQVGLFGGPVFSLYKALSAVKLAREATAAGVNAVPVFWLATTDHDLAEVNHVSLPGANGALATLTTPMHGTANAPVSNVFFGTEIEPLVKQASELLGTSEVTEILQSAYRPLASLGSAFGRLFAELFAEWGVILLDASDPELHEVSAPIYRAAIERAAELDERLLARGKALEAAGYHQQVKVTSSSTLLFGLHEGARTVIHRKHNGKQGNGEFLIGEEKISAGDLLKRIADSPEQFSANVLLRPVVQDYLLPTLAYVGGAAEVAYFAQAAVVYEALAGRITPVLPRFSATLVEPKVQRLLAKYGIELTALFHGEEALRETLVAGTLPAELQQAFEEANRSLEASQSKVSASLSQLDVTLVEAAQRAQSKMRYQLNRLRSRAARAEARHNELIGRHVQQLADALFPHRNLQERSVGGVYFLARYGRELLHQLYEAMHTDCYDHQMVYL
jgi:bacillithiol biosynthesis cysteine-adding enzyme BshC